MSKKRRRNEDTTEVRIPIGRLPAGADLGAMASAMSRPGVMPGAIDVATIEGAMVAGAWWRTVRGVDQCGESHRDKLIVSLLRPDAVGRVENAERLIVLTAIDECEGRRVNLFFDRESVRELVNRIGEAIAESERREAAATGKAVG